MFSLLADALKPDEFLIALLGHFVNEGSAKITFSVVRAVGLAALGFAFEVREKGQETRAAKKRTRPRSRHPSAPSRGRRRRGRGVKKAKV